MCKVTSFLLRFMVSPVHWPVLTQAHRTSGHGHATHCEDENARKGMISWSTRTSKSALPGVLVTAISSICEALSSHQHHMPVFPLASWL